MTAQIQTKNERIKIMANFNFNKVIIGGRLTADPELKTTNSGVSVASFSVAVNRRFGNKNGEEQQADFINVTAWRQQAELVTRYFKKGSSICVVGSIQTRNWTDQTGNKRYTTEILADNIRLLDKKGSQTAASPVEAQSAGFALESEPTDNDLPF
jgi:single-strand DNA-binding protein